MFGTVNDELTCYRKLSSKSGKGYEITCFYCLELWMKLEKLSFNVVLGVAGLLFLCRGFTSMARRLWRKESNFVMYKPKFQSTTINKVLLRNEKYEAGLILVIFKSKGLTPDHSEAKE
ncbi:hypothetical protein RCL_jg23122.t1 [Rhizophagus clarus]|uniref:Uncharacterized protein n=1 Tax=Rhizophagus clarus TaxID=94130 RepID=A0A8H3L6C2_9GLOM|nr:hypothetical protein RCL_jg23122.t1 [Rhizophagus clarus]